MPFQKIVVPPEGRPIQYETRGPLQVPDCPIVPFVEGDGIGPDIMAAAMIVWNAAVEKAYAGRRRIAWTEVYAGEKACATYGADVWLPDETLEAIRRYVVAVKGPLTTPIGGGFRSLNVALRQRLDLYVCLRPVRWFPNVPSPVRHPERTDMVVFRENTEDIYAGIEWEAGSREAQRLLRFLEKDLGVKGIRFPETSALGLKPISEQGSKRLIRAAIRYAWENKRPSVTLVHKGNIMKYTEGAFKRWGYELARGEMADIAVAAEDCDWQAPQGKVLVKDVIADAFLQQILTRPADYSVVATMNLNGDYISDALAACVGGIGIAPGGNINYETGAAVFEATHGTAPKYAGLDKVNPGSIILSGVMMLEYMGWQEAADLIVAALCRTFGEKIFTYDFARLTANAREVGCRQFGREVALRM